MTQDERAAKALYMREYRAGNPAVRNRGRVQVQAARYGMTVAERNQLFEDSDGLCASCYDEVATTVDHDHATGQPRGALCSPCNTGLGHFRDDPARLLAAVEYLGVM